MTLEYTQLSMSIILVSQLDSLRGSPNCSQPLIMSIKDLKTQKQSYSATSGA